MQDIKVTAPGAKACGICGSEHDPMDPHDRNSLYYQYIFYKRHKRFPSWNDAMEHCGEITKACFREKLILRGIDPDDTERHDGRMD